MYMRQKNRVRYFDRASVVHSIQMCWTNFSRQNLNNARTQTVKTNSKRFKADESHLFSQ